jgi:hypothetical protein
LRGTLSFGSQPDSMARLTAWFGAIVFAANPNLVYLQATAMTETLYLAFAIWAVVHFNEFVQATSLPKAAMEASSSLTKCGFCLFVACLTRYDGWLLAAALGVAGLVVIVPSQATREKFRGSLAKFLLLAAAAPALWLAYNALIYHNPLEFANGPYSAHAIEARAEAAAPISQPGSHDLPVAFRYFLKSAEDNVAESWLQKVWLVLLVGGILIALRPRHWPLLFFLLPIVFYAASISYGSVPIHLPEWWPFNYYNVRYGIELLPAFAIFAALTFHVLSTRVSYRRGMTASVIVMIAIVAGSYAWIWKTQPICYREAWVNSRTRVAFETSLASTLLKLPHDSTLLMYLGEHVGTLQEAGIPLKRVINESNHRVWKRPPDPQGLWERALADPEKYADYVIAFQGDPVAKQVNMRGLTSMVVIHTIGQAPATIYWTHRPLSKQVH